MGLVITYDLRAPGQDYEPLYAELKRLEAWRVLESVWCYGGSMEPEVMMEHLRSEFLIATMGCYITPPW